MNIKDFAKLLNVSTATVSKALNDKPDISEATKKMVKEAAKRYNYTPVPLAKFVKREQNPTYALMLPCDDNHDFEQSPFYLRLYQGIYNSFKGTNINLIMVSSDSQSDEIKQLKKICESNIYSGVFLTDSRVYDNRVRYLQEKRFPFVCLGRSGFTPEVSYVDLNFEAMASEVVEFLSSRSFSKIALIVTGDFRVYANTFLESFKQNLIATGVTVYSDYILYCANSATDAYSAMQKLCALKERPEAVIIMNDIQTQGALKYLNDNNITNMATLCLLASSDLFKHKYRNKAAYFIDLNTIGMHLYELMQREVKGQPPEGRSLNLCFANKEAITNNDLFATNFK